MISIVKQDHSYSRQNLTVQCSCGRTLRAKIEQAGSQIQCWDCHRMVPVPFPRSTGEVSRALKQGWDEISETSMANLMVAAAAVLTVLLTAPRIGVPLGVLGLIAAGFGYGELLQRSELAGDRAGEAPPEDAPNRSRRLRQWGMAVVFGLVLGAPYLLSPGGLGRAARMEGWFGPLLAVLAAVLLPLGMLAAFAPGGPRLVLPMLRWRARSVLLSLALVPCVLVLIELGLIFASFFLGIFGGFLIDLVPPPKGVAGRLHVPADWIFHFGIPADVHFLDLYGHRLRRGYTLIGAVPPSLMLPSVRIYREFWASDVTLAMYFLLRFVFTLIAVATLFVGLALQARWLGLIARLEAKFTSLRPAAPPASAPAVGRV